MRHSMNTLKLNKKKLKNLSARHTLDVKQTKKVAGGQLQLGDEYHSQSCPTTRG